MRFPLLLLIGFMASPALAQGPQVSPSIIVMYADDLDRCPAQVARGLDVAIVPHLDGAEAGSRWRNELAFDPLQAYPTGANLPPRSYGEAMLEPLIAALERAAAPDTRVTLALQGEMGRTVFEHPDRYRELVVRLRRRLRARGPAEVGVSFNYNKIDGFIEMTWFEESERGRRRHAEVQQLLHEIDFLGLSAYRETHSAPTAFDFHEAIRRFLLDWTYRDLHVPSGLPLMFSEMGIGGGRRENDGRLPAQTAREAALHPWSGVFGEHDPPTDPWRNPRLRDFRRAYFRALEEFLADQTASSRVTRVFLWNLDSWDVLGLFPGMELYADPEVVEALRRFNRSR